MNVDHAFDFIPLGRNKLEVSTMDSEGSVCHGYAQCSYSTRLPPPTCLRPNLLTRTKTFQRGITTFNTPRSIRPSLSLEDLPSTSNICPSLLLNQPNGDGIPSRDTQVLKAIFKRHTHREPFRDFLISQFCTENLDFWVSAEVYRTICRKYNLSDEQRFSFAVHIYDKFFSTESNEAVNVESSTRKRIKHAISNKICPADLFLIAQEQIFYLLKFDCWPRFVKNGGREPYLSTKKLEEEETVDILCDYSFTCVNRDDSADDVFRILSSASNRSDEVPQTSTAAPKLVKSKSVIWRIGRKASSLLPKREMEDKTHWRRSDSKSSMCGVSTIKELSGTDVRRRKRLSLLSAFSVFSNGEPSPVTV